MNAPVIAKVAFTSEGRVRCDPVGISGFTTLTERLACAGEIQPPGVRPTDHPACGSRLMP
jgi:hypothetical protein